MCGGFVAFDPNQLCARGHAGHREHPGKGSASNLERPIISLDPSGPRVRREHKPRNQPLRAEHRVTILFSAFPHEFRVRATPLPTSPALELSRNKSVSNAADGSCTGAWACASAHRWSPDPQARGHTVKQMPPAYVKPHVKRHKNDAADAEAICRAVSLGVGMSLAHSGVFAIAFPGGSRLPYFSDLQASQAGRIR